MPPEPVMESGNAQLAEDETGATEEGIEGPPLAEEPVDPVPPAAIKGAEDAIDVVSRGLTQARTTPDGLERPATSPGRTGPAPPHSAGVNPASIARGSSCSTVGVWMRGCVDAWTDSGIAWLAPAEASRRNLSPPSWASLYECSERSSRNRFKDRNATLRQGRCGRVLSAALETPPSSDRSDRLSSGITGPGRFLSDPAGARTRLERLRPGCPSADSARPFPCPVPPRPAVACRRAVGRSILCNNQTWGLTGGQAAS